MRLEAIDVRNATALQYAALNALTNEIRAERLPEDPPIPLDEDIRRLRSLPAYIDVSGWTIADGGAVVAYGSMNILRTEENRHLAEFTLAVRPPLRRLGLGTRLLERIAHATRREGRTLLVAETYSTAPDGSAFLQRIGARAGLEMHANQLDLRDLNRDLLTLWQDRATERAAGFDLLMWEDDYPEEHLEAFSRVLDVMNRAPRGSLQVEDFHVTPDHLRQWNHAVRERGLQRWTIVARERASGRFAGFTEVTWHPNRPEILYQEGTGVLPEFQNRGLGRWMKAAMLDQVLGERPQIRRVRTGNADSNAPMLKINIELGFKPYISVRVWQVGLTQVEAYLDSVRATKLVRA